MDDKRLLRSQLLQRLWRHINPRRRKQFALLFVLMFMASFAEILSIGALMPFLGVLTMPEQIFDHATAQPFIQALGITAPAQLLLPLTIVFMVAVSFAGLMRLFLLWANAKLSSGTGADISISVYRRTLYQPYSVHCNRNSSEVINAITSKTDVVVMVISTIISASSSTVMLIGILIALFSIDPFVALSAIGGFGFIYVFISRLTRGRLAMNSQVSARETTQVIKSLQEGLGGIRDVLIDGSQSTYCQIYRNADLPLRRLKAENEVISMSPRFIVEALGMVLIAALAYSLARQEEGFVQVVPILGALALGAQRLLPVLQQLYAGWAFLRSANDALHDALELMEQPLPDYVGQPVMQPLPFNDHISLNQLGFRYSSQEPYVLKQLNLTIAKGSRVGFIGVTGSGKSTLLDIIMGLLQPTNGLLQIDNQTVTLSNNRAWQAHIAHVPQAIFLADSTIEENIAFGVAQDQIDYQRVRQAAQQAQIAESIESWPKKYQTFVGERGIRLSGGQRQRIGIARALYKRADVIIFDEATSALDNETEHAVMQSIEGLSSDLTVLIIAHRLTTLKNCTQIVELGKGGIKRVGSYQDIAK